MSTVHSAPGDARCTVAERLNVLFAPEEFDRCSCHACEGGRKASKGLVISAPPAALVVILGRPDYDFDREVAIFKDNPVRRVQD